MTEQHPITPPPKLVREWMERTQYDEHTWFYESYIAEQAARWGADQELEACCEWLEERIGGIYPRELRAARRPKPPSIKQQAIEALQRAEEGWRPIPEDCDIIRRALEALPDD